MDYGLTEPYKKNKEEGGKRKEKKGKRKHKKARGSYLSALYM